MLERRGKAARSRKKKGGEEPHKMQDGVLVRLKRFNRENQKILFLSPPSPSPF